ncbi:MAG TPA: Rdx family protein [Terriglobales bacterium]|nr:Rdx family protein [Terriglobales bacterium]
MDLILQAGRLKRALRDAFEVKPEMHFAGTGVLDVLVDGKLVFSHQQEGRAADPDDIVRRVRALDTT